MAGMSPAAQMLGLPGDGDVTADEAKRRAREAAKKQDPLTDAVAGAANLFTTYGQATRDLLSTTPADLKAAGGVASELFFKRKK